MNLPMSHTGHRPVFCFLAMWVGAAVSGVGAAHAQPTIADPQWTETAVVSLPNAQAAHFTPAGDQVIVGTRGTSPDAVLRVTLANHLITTILTTIHVAGIEVDADGDIFFSNDYEGRILRIPDGTSTEETWVTGFQAGDDDPVGLAIAPDDYAGSVVAPGMALEIDRGNNGADVIYAWSPDTPEGEALVHTDSGQLVDALDIAISATHVWAADGGGAADGTIYEVTAGGVLVALATSIPLPEPQAIDIDPVTGHIYVLDSTLGAVVRIDPSDGQVTTVLSGLVTSATSWAGIDFSAGGAQFVITETTGIRVFARCDAAGPGPGEDCDNNGVLDVCDTSLGAPDCNANSRPDSCNLADGSSMDCNSDGLPDECLACPPVEVVFVMDTSASMDNEAAALCSQIDAVLDGLALRNVEASAHILGISDAPGGAYSCLEGHVIGTLGTAVPGSPPANLAVLGACPGGSEVASEDWARATAVVAGLFPWQSGATRLVVPISDEGAWCGDPSTSDDEESVEHAVSVAAAHDVIVSPIVASGASTAVHDSAAAMAAGTGGQKFSSSQAESDIAQGVSALVLAACMATDGDCDNNGQPDSCELDAGTAADCNANLVIDACEVAADPTLDCNDNASPDSCDLAQGQSQDCDSNGVPDECPVCPTLDLVFVMDTSSSMDAEAEALCADIAEVEEQLAWEGISVQSTILGITAAPGGAYSCLQGTVVANYGTTVPGNPPGELAVLADCPGGVQSGSEDWGRAVAVVAEEHPWGSGHVRLIVPITDEGPWCGDPVTAPGVDQDAVELAGVVAAQRNAIVSPLLGTGTPAAVAALATQLAAATGGTVNTSVEPNTDIATSILSIVQAACLAASDCDASGVPDSCEVAAGTVADCNANSIPDSCDIAAGAADADLDGVLDACVAPSFACAWPCCEPSASPGCGDVGVQACVCALDDTCCSAAWTVECVRAAIDSCGLVCAQAPACCIGPLASAGCGADTCESCVCEVESFCCATAWDESCSALATGACSGACGCYGGFPPVCQAAGDVSGSGRTNVADAICAILASLALESGSAPPACLSGNT